MHRSCFVTQTSSYGHGLSMIARWHTSIAGNSLRVPQRVLMGAFGATVAGPSSTFTLSRWRTRRRWLTSRASSSRARQPSVNRDVVVSVLEASATRRDAMNYLQKYAPKSKSSTGSLQAMEDRSASRLTLETTEPTNVAIVVLRDPQKLDARTLRGVAKTLTQLRTLGLLSVVVIDCGFEEDNRIFQDEALRLCEAIDIFGKPSVKLAQGILTGRHRHSQDLLPKLWDEVMVEDQGLLNRALQNDMIVVIPSLAYHGEIFAPQPSDARQTIMALAKYFNGMQFGALDCETTPRNNTDLPSKIASVERIIILDMLGGTPVPGRPGVCQRFVNLEQEYDTLSRHLLSPDDVFLAPHTQTKVSLSTHMANLKLARDTLMLLPATSSALVTTPYAAANCAPVATAPTLLAMDDPLNFGMVTTRNRQNPLLHNLLTDKPVFSSSLPMQRTQVGAEKHLHAGHSIEATLVKKGMPLTIYPDPIRMPWVPPEPGSHRLRLTDSCIDLPRLINLIEDSFGRKLDVDGYLQRVNGNLAGIIIAGDYEGVAILTWERPDDVDATKAYLETRFVPYLDKFAVLKSRQGSGGVADMVFNAMVRDCFPQGVCWRSRKNNPVNKWYFERSTGMSKLPDSNWAMFWTTPKLASEHQTLQDYEAVCREIVSSWAESP